MEVSTTIGVRMVKRIDKNLFTTLFFFFALSIKIVFVVQNVHLKNIHKKKHGTHTWSTCTMTSTIWWLFHQFKTNCKMLNGTKLIYIERLISIHLWRLHLQICHEFWAVFAVVCLFFSLSVSCNCYFNLKCSGWSIVTVHLKLPVEYMAETFDLNA